MPLQPDSQRAAAIRLIVMTLVADGELDAGELDALDRHRLAERLGVDGDALIEAVIDHCRSVLLHAESPGPVRAVDPKEVERLLDRVLDPELRKLVCRAMLVLSKADGQLAEAEQTLLRQTLTHWNLTLDSVAERP